MKPQHIAYLLFRIPIGISFFGHGLARLPKQGEFAQWMVSLFSESWIPLGLVNIFAFTLPFVELMIGVLILSGIWIKTVAIAGVILMSTLILGSSVIEDWSAVGIQMFYGAYLSGIYLFAEHNRFSAFKSN